MSQTLEVVIGEGGRIEIPETEFAPGTSVVVTIALKTTPAPPLSPEERKAHFEKMWELSDKAIAEGMETWNIDRINAEVRGYRYEDVKAMLGRDPCTEGA